MARGELWQWEGGGPTQVTLVVSSDVRNQVLDKVLVCPVVPQQYRLPHTVVLGDMEPLQGTVLCDFIYTAEVARLRQGFGPITPAAMAAVDEQLVAALDLPT
ncbi:MAG: type II toxin-antitoxin system PemK/MazF family toxin [Acidimicrobiales bacterium]